MEKYAVLLGYFDKQLALAEKLYNEIILVDVHVYDKQFFFAIRAQQFYTAIEDLFKQIAKSFENHIENMGNFHKEMLMRMNTEVPKIRPMVISKDTMLFLDKVRAFRHFIRHAYDCELNEKELLILQDRLKQDYPKFKHDLVKFRSFIKELT